MKITHDIAYGTDALQQLDLIEPDHSNGAALLDIHGGGWFRGDKSKELQMAQHFADEGYLVAVPNYRLAPANLFPASRDDVLTAFSWLQDKAKAEGITKVGVFGTSAGGSLSVDVGLATGVPAVSWSGIFDVIDWFSKHQDVVAAPPKPTALQVTESAKIDQGGPDDPFYKWFISNYVGGDTSQFAQIEPFDRVTKNAGPVYLANSQNEIIPTSGVFMLAQALAKVGVASMIQLVPGGQHAEGYLDQALKGTLAFYQQFLLEE